MHEEAVKFEDHPDKSLVDVTAAGDCFMGALAFKLLNGSPDREALAFANQIGFLCVTKFGAVPSVPSYAEWETSF